MRNSGPSPLHHPWFWMLSNAPDNVTIGFCALVLMSLHGTSRETPGKKRHELGRWKHAQVGGHLPSIIFGCFLKHHPKLIFVIVGRKSKFVFFCCPEKRDNERLVKDEHYQHGSWESKTFHKTDRFQQNFRFYHNFPTTKLRYFQMLLTWPFPGERHACFYLFSKEGT